MKTIPLRVLVREPCKVKRWTRAGQSVQVTDNGEPLWTILAAPDNGDEAKRQKEINELLAEVLRESQSPISLSQLIKVSRR